jgi:hypothetical protein
LTPPEFVTGDLNPPNRSSALRVSCKRRRTEQDRTSNQHVERQRVGHDIGMWTGYALAADHPERVGRLTVVDAIIPGLTPTPSVFSPATINQRFWHFGFNRLTDLNEELVRGRERLFFGYQFAKKAATPDAIPAYAVDVYVDAIVADQRGLRASFAYYRALDETIAQNEQRRKTRLTLPVLAIGGARYSGAAVAETMRLAADDVTGVVLDDCGHYMAEEQPARFAEILEDTIVLATSSGLVGSASCPPATSIGRTPTRAASSTPGAACEISSSPST